MRLPAGDKAGSELFHLDVQLPRTNVLWLPTRQPCLFALFQLLAHLPFPAAKPSHCFPSALSTQLCELLAKRVAWACGTAVAKSHKLACSSYRWLLAEKAKVCAMKLSDSCITDVPCVLYRTIFIFFFFKRSPQVTPSSLSPIQNGGNELKYCRGGGKGS